MPSIFFKKQMLGQWRRNDGESLKHVSEESMFREMEKLVLDGWQLTRYGETHTRMYELKKD